MNFELSSLILPLAVGLGLGLFYFGGLWLTVRHIAQSRHPGALVAMSFLVRTAITSGGFGMVMQGQWERVAACMLTFLVVRFAMIHIIRSETAPPFCAAASQFSTESRPVDQL